MIKAILQNNSYMVRWLLAQNASPNQRDNITNATPLIYAAEVGTPEIVETLLNADAKVKNRDSYGFTALMTAAKYNKAEIVELLLDRGSNRNARNKLNQTALQIATVHHGKDAYIVHLIKSYDQHQHRTKRAQ